MNNYLIHNALIINEGKRFTGYVHILNGTIEAVGEGAPNFNSGAAVKLDAQGKYLLPGVIDDQVHFREPGLTHKGDIASESRAAAAGGVTSYMEMPNTNPQTIHKAALEEKHLIAARSSLVNYSFYLGATNDNLQEIKNADPSIIPGIKVFMGSSTGNMLVDDQKTLEGIFAESPVLIATHCEDEAMIRENLAHYRASCGENVAIQFHPVIRSAEACYKSSARAVELAHKYDSRLHVLHISTARELGLFSSDPRSDKKITAEVCVHHLWFDHRDYASRGNFIKWNPAVKSEADRQGLIEGLLNGKLDVIATDHAPHTLEEKQQTYFKAPSGGPMVQHSLPAMLQLSVQGLFRLEFVVDKMCHAPAELFKVKNRGFIRKGYHADLVLVNPDKAWTVGRNSLLYKCGWSPMEGTDFTNSVETTFVNGTIVYDKGKIVESKAAMPLQFGE